MAAGNTGFYGHYAVSMICVLTSYKDFVGWDHLVPLLPELFISLCFQ